MKDPKGIIVRRVATARDLAAFIRVPDPLYRDDPNWVRPLRIERRGLLDRRKNPYFEHAEARYWIARRDGVAVGRISAQVDRIVEERTGERIGHFGMFESIADERVVEALFDTAEAWLRERGCLKVQGPFNLSVNGECGLLVEGLDTPPAVMMAHNPAHYADLVTGRGYRKAIDLYAYELDLTRGPGERITRFVEASRRNPSYDLRMPDMRRYNDELATVIDIFNDAWSNNWGFVPLTGAEARHVAKEIKPLIDPHLTRICYYKGTPMAMMVTLYDLNTLIRDLDGRLLPFGWTRLLWRLKQGTPKRRVRVPLMGVRKQMQGSRHGATMALLLIEAIRQSAVARGSVWAELSWILEDNRGMRSILEEIGCHLYKTYRIYEKPLAPI